MFLTKRITMMILALTTTLTSTLNAFPYQFECQVAIDGSNLELSRKPVFSNSDKKTLFGKNGWSVQRIPSQMLTQIGFRLSSPDGKTNLSAWGTDQSTIISSSYQRDGEPQLDLDCRTN